jgi:predicted dehydrogenase
MKETIDRRNFVKTVGTAAAGALLAGSLPVLLIQCSSPLRDNRYRTSRRRVCGGKDVAARYQAEIEFVGLCDKNAKRAEAGRKLIGVECPTYTNFDEMLEKSKPDVVMVTTMDSTHHTFITRALEKGIDVITEKPMVTEAAQCQSVLDAEKKHNRSITVAFNYRYAPKHEKIKQIIQSGEIGRVTSVDFSWYLDTSHGADYFRRWHRLNPAAGVCGFTRRRIISI